MSHNEPTNQQAQKHADTIYDHENALRAIATAINENLCVEIMWSAMVYLKDHPEATIEDAVNFGFGEWIK